MSGALTALPGVLSGITTPFDPSDISGMKLWLKADSIVGLNDGDLVTDWNDDSGTGNDASAFAGGRPTYKTAIINSLPVVRFNGTSNVMSLTTPYTSTTVSIFAVFKEASFLFIALGGGTGTGANTMFGSAYGAASSLLWRAEDDSGLTLSDTNPGTFIVLSGVSSSGSAEMWRDGTSKGSGTVSGTINYAATGLRNVVQYGIGDLAELIVYDSAVSSTNRVNVQNFLKSKYGL